MRPLLRPNIGLWLALRRRASFAKKYLAGNGLEIGALHSPVKLPRGAVAAYVDRATREESVAKFPELNPKDIVKVDYVTNGFTLDGVPSFKFDFLIANHVLEHTPNPIGVLTRWHEVLKESGVILCALPGIDMDFDRGRELTSCAHILEDYELYRQHKYAAVRERNKAHYLEWVTIAEPAVLKRPHPSAESIRQRLEASIEKEEEIHFHTFTLETVRELFALISERVLPDLRILKIVKNRGEILVAVRKGTVLK